MIGMNPIVQAPYQLLLGETLPVSKTIDNGGIRTVPHIQNPRPVLWQEFSAAPVNTVVNDCVLCTEYGYRTDATGHIDKPNQILVKRLQPLRSRTTIVHAEHDEDNVWLMFQDIALEPGFLQATTRAPHISGMDDFDICVGIGFAQRVDRKRDIVLLIVGMITRPGNAITKRGYGHGLTRL